MVSGDALMSIINNILDFSRIEREKTAIELEEFILSDCIEEALDSVALMAGEKGLNLAYKIDRAMAAGICSDRNKLKQILVRLLDDVVRFTEKGEVPISASSKDCAGYCEVHFTISDTGTGITPERMEILFESYSEVMDRLSRSFCQTDFESFSGIDSPGRQSRCQHRPCHKPQIGGDDGRENLGREHSGKGIDISFFIKAQQADLKSPYCRDPA